MPLDVSRRWRNGLAETGEPHSDSGLHRAFWDAEADSGLGVAHAADEGDDDGLALLGREGAQRIPNAVAPPQRGPAAAPVPATGERRLQVPVCPGSPTRHLSGVSDQRSFKL